jgi:hypothetical protein
MNFLSIRLSLLFGHCHFALKFQSHDSLLLVMMMTSPSDVTCTTDMQILRSKRGHRS